MKALAVAANTVRETLRERLMYNLAIFGLILIGGSLTISQLTLGEQFRIIADIGTGSTQLFATLIAVFLGVAIVARELDRRTCYAALARPVSRGEFLVGKYLGLVAVLALNVAAMAAATALMLLVYRGSGDAFGLHFVAAFLLILVQVALCAAFAVLFSSFSTPTLAVILTLAVIGIGHVFGEVRGFWLTSPEVGLKSVVRVLDFVVPNLGLLDMKEALTYGDAVAPLSLLARVGYGLGWAGAVVALAAVVFSRKDVR
ncbi:MAG TPA: ABC transporter permease subunit [Anaeromyxobacter sp.]|nr:ABC transporter permease subunit [Anaeromyxobacter sp.]